MDRRCENFYTCVQYNLYKVVFFCHFITVGVKILGLQFYLVSAKYAEPLEYFLLSYLGMVLDTE